MGKQDEGPGHSVAAVPRTDSAAHGYRVGEDGNDEEGHHKTGCQRGHTPEREADTPPRVFTGSQAPATEPPRSAR